MIWLYLLGGAGITIVLVMSTLFESIRNAIPPPVGFRGLDPETTTRLIMLACTLCTGAWVCFFVGLYAINVDLLPRWFTRLGDTVLFAFAGALVSYFCGTWLRKHDRKD